MTISNTRFRQILREEAANSFTKQSINSFKFSKSEISALQEIRYMRINEQVISLVQAGRLALQALMFLLKTKVGRKILIAILKGVKHITGLEGMVVRKIGVPVINKAIAFAEKHSGVNIPFSGEDLLEFFQHFMPNYWATLGIGKLIELLEDTSDQEFKSVMNDIDTKVSDSKDGDNTEQLAANNTKQFAANESIIRSHAKSYNRKLQIIMGR